MDSTLETKLDASALRDKLVSVGQQMPVGSRHTWCMGISRPGWTEITRFNLRVYSPFVDVNCVTSDIPYFAEPQYYYVTVDYIQDSR